MEDKKEVQELLMDAMANFVIAEKNGEYAVAYHYMQKVDALFSITYDEYAMLSLWRQVFASTL